MYLVLAMPASLSTAGAFAFLAPPHTVEGLRLTVSTDRLFYAPEEPVHLYFNLTNVGTENVTVLRGGCAFRYSVADRAGDLIYNSIGHRICPLYVLLLTLEPGASIRGSAVWMQVDDAGSPVPPMSWYTIQGTNEWNVQVPFSQQTATVFIAQ